MFLINRCFTDLDNNIEKIDGYFIKYFSPKRYREQIQFPPPKKKKVIL